MVLGITRPRVYVYPGNARTMYNSTHITAPSPVAELVVVWRRARDSVIGTFHTGAPRVFVEGEAGAEGYHLLARHGGESFKLVGLLLLLRAAAAWGAVLQGRDIVLLHVDLCVCVCVCE